ncbi:STAS domain-containing protein [Blastopirellula marina]|uniref:Anti-sigma factor antagonist n=1 Tax=Blastopirellula marina TaxID=124 RepID=A0A2S8F862_9BACT|nr:STAS domain-containing protein [Blastopirellula marina]PQO28348.1 anti-sigma factor antagonist [Blastopirellula marina]PTL41888.1 anti-sigma factor antagonist [Blastopirellula marina]
MAIKYHYLKVRDAKDVVVAEFIQSSILDETAIDRVGKEFEQLVLEAATAKKLLLNFQAIEYMSSAMIGKLILLNKNCKQAKIKFKVCNVSGNILEVFQIMKIGKVIEIHKDEKSALDTFSGPSISRWLGLG